MIGIIYKFTILARYRMDGHKPFYVGQHWERISVDNFILRKRSNYYGCGRIWNKFVKRIKQDYPNNWHKFIKREVLYASEMVNQKGLDVLEEYYIKKEKAHYSFGLGGTNVLWGTANKFGSGSPAKDPLVRKIIREKAKERMNRPEVKEHMRKLFSGDRFIGKNNPFYGKKHTIETKNKIREFRKSLPKKYNIGDKNALNSNWVWTEYKPGKFDWRAKDRKLSYSKSYKNHDSHNY